MIVRRELSETMKAKVAQVARALDSGNFWHPAQQIFNEAEVYFYRDEDYCYVGDQNGDPIGDEFIFRNVHEANTVIESLVQLERD